MDEFTTISITADAHPRIASGEEATSMPDLGMRPTNLLLSHDSSLCMDDETYFMHEPPMFSIRSIASIEVQQRHLQQIHRERTSVPFHHEEDDEYAEAKVKVRSEVDCNLHQVPVP